MLKVDKIESDIDFLPSAIFVIFRRTCWRIDQFINLVIALLMINWSKYQNIEVQLFQVIIVDWFDSVVM